MRPLIDSIYDSRWVALAETGFVPDGLIRWMIRRGLAARIVALNRGGAEAARAREREFMHAMRESPIALSLERANDPHCELPPSFFARVLGAQLKYSACLYPMASVSLDDAEAAMLELTATHAALEDGMRVLDLGCGWGAFALYGAQRYPNSEFVAVSNSKPQGEWIRAQRDARNVENLRVVTADMNTFEADVRFDRVVSIEMFEHMRNWPALLERIASWLDPQGRLFLQYFCHRDYAYSYETDGIGDWISRYFLAGGMMPSAEMLSDFDEHFAVDRRWQIEGTHYQHTSEAWLANMDAQREELLLILGATYGLSNARKWFGRWRLFFIACAERFGYRGGTEWFVQHVRLAPTHSASRDAIV